MPTPQPPTEAPSRSEPQVDEPAFLSEHSLPLEQADKYRAIQTLKDVGLLVDFSALETFHGRLQTNQSDDWRVLNQQELDRRNVYNQNVYHQRALYVSDRPTAEKFAQARFNKDLNTRLTREQLLNRRIRQDALAVEHYKYQAEQGKTISFGDYLSLPATQDFLASDSWFNRWSEISPEARQGYYQSLSQPDRQDFDVSVAVATDSQTAIYEIAAHKSDALLLDTRAFWRERYPGLADDSLNRAIKADKHKVTEALLQILPARISEVLPFAFEDRHRIDQLAETFMAKTGSYISGSEIDQAIKANPPSHAQGLRQIATSINARIFLLLNPIEAANQMMDSPDEGFEIQFKHQPIPISSDYIKSAFQSLGVVGLIGDMNSGTLKERVDGVVSLFDLEEVDKAELIQEQKQEAISQMWQTGEALQAALAGDSPLLKLLNNNLHASPQAVVETAALVDGFKEIFEASTGVWEGFSLAEHTETVLRNYADYFADSLPVPMQNVLKLALLTHDLGKPIVRAHNIRDKSLEHVSNIHWSAKFLEKIGLGDKAIKYIHHLFEANQEYAAIYLDSSSSSFEPIRARAKVALEQIDVRATAEAIEGFLKATSILFACDSGAYTAKATTRNERGQSYRNYDSFGNSFDAGSDKLKLKRRQT